MRRNYFTQLSVFNIQLIFLMVINNGKKYGLMFCVVLAYLGASIWVAVDICWVVAGGGGWWWVVVGF